MVWLVIPSSTIAVFLGCWRHKDRLVLVGAAAGLTTLVLTAIFGHDVLGETGEKVTTLIASIMLALAHWRNFWLCRQDSCGHCS